MCDPLSITAAALSIGGAAVDASAQNKVDKQNKRAARTALGIENRAISLRILQERVAASQEREINRIQSAEASGLTATSAAAGGVGGMTVDLLMQEVESGRLLNDARITDQLDATEAVIASERAGVAATARNRANQTSRANPFAVGLRIGAGAVDAYGGYLQRQPASAPSPRPTSSPSPKIPKKTP